MAESQSRLFSKEILSTSKLKSFTSPLDSVTNDISHSWGFYRSVNLNHDSSLVIVNFIRSTAGS